MKGGAKDAQIAGRKAVGREESRFRVGIVREHRGEASDAQMAEREMV